MAGPRSLSRSTKVAAPGGSRKHAKGKGKYHKKKAPLATWDHDNSSADESVDEEPAAAAASAAPSTGKKRPRAGTLKAVEAEAKDQDGEEAGTPKSSGGGSKRPRAAEEGEEGPGSGSDGEDDDMGGGGEGGGEEEDGGGAAAAPTGGMGDVMARILGQKLDSRVQAPVLAKRKTRAMKEMENASVKRAESRGKSAARRANMTQQFVIPDHTTTDYERQLKKIATRGVVALFNAISKRQNQGEGSGGGGGGGTVAGTAKASAAKGASRHAFLDMLKTGVKPTGEAGTATAAAGGKRGGGSQQGGGGVGGGADGGAEGGGRSWSVLKEDYMMGASSMKNWDQESVDSEEDALGGANDMSGDDSD